MDDLLLLLSNGTNEDASELLITASPIIGKLPVLLKANPIIFHLSTFLNTALVCRDYYIVEINADNE